jgi:hypothetical protein
MLSVIVVKVMAPEREGSIKLITRSEENDTKKHFFLLKKSTHKQLKINRKTYVCAIHKLFLE